MPANPLVSDYVTALLKSNPSSPTSHSSSTASSSTAMDPIIPNPHSDSINGNKNNTTSPNKIKGGKDGKKDEKDMMKSMPEEWMDLLMLNDAIDENGHLTQERHYSEVDSALRRMLIILIAREYQVRETEKKKAREIIQWIEKNCGGESSLLSSSLETALLRAKNVLSADDVSETDPNDGNNVLRRQTFDEVVDKIVTAQHGLKRPQTNPHTTLKGMTVRNVTQVDRIMTPKRLTQWEYLHPHRVPDLDSKRIVSPSDRNSGKCNASEDNLVQTLPITVTTTTTPTPPATTTVTTNPSLSTNISETQSQSLRVTFKSGARVVAHPSLAWSLEGTVERGLRAFDNIYASGLTQRALYGLVGSLAGLNLRITNALRNSYSFSSAVLLVMLYCETVVMHGRIPGMDRDMVTLTEAFTWGSLEGKDTNPWGSLLEDVEVKQVLELNSEREVLKAKEFAWHQLMSLAQHRVITSELIVSKRYSRYGERVAERYRTVSLELVEKLAAMDTKKRRMVKGLLVKVRETHEPRISDDLPMFERTDQDESVLGEDGYEDDEEEEDYDESEDDGMDDYEEDNDSEDEDDKHRLS